MKTKDDYLALVERTLSSVLPTPHTRPQALSEALCYAVGSGGKRIRPLLCLAAAEAVGGRAEDAVYPAAALELLHNYTLVHDDLPEMDNDTLRRGRPTVWAKYGPALAILVGDALQALAFRTAARAPRHVAEILDVLVEKGVGVVCGQVEDLTLDRDPAHVSSDTVDYVYEHKTADLFVAACVTGALAGDGSPASVDALRQFGLNLGLAFQYEDDLLDGDAPYSVERTRQLVREMTDRALASLVSLPGDVTFLSDLARRLIGRAV